MTLATRILIVVGLLGSLLAAVLIADLVPAWRDMRQADAHQQLNTASSAFVVAAGALATERGLTNGMLAAPGPADAETRHAIAGSRDKLMAALSRGSALAPIASGSPCPPPSPSSIGCVAKPAVRQPP